MARRKKRNRRRRHSFAVLYKLLCLALIVSAVVAALALFFKVEEIRVSGNNRYTQQEIIAASGVKSGDNLFIMNKYDVAGRIRDAHSYVESVSITRDLPGTLCIHINECTCAVALVQEGKAWLLCDTGKIVDSVAGSAVQDCALVTGLTLLNPQLGAAMQADEENEYARQQLMEMLGQLRSKGMLEDVQEIHLENSEYITVRYLDRFDVEIPWDADFDYKFDFLAAVVAKLENYETGTLKMMTDGEARLIAG